MLSCGSEAIITQPNRRILFLQFAIRARGIRRPEGSLPSLARIQDWDQSQDAEGVILSDEPFTLTSRVCRPFLAHEPRYWR